MKVHLFGLPISAHRRLELESDGWEDAVPAPHSFSSKPISTNDQAPFTPGELRDLRNLVSNGFTHIVVPGSRDWKAVQATLQFDCRLHVARLYKPVRDTPWPILQTYLHAAAALDEEWLKKVAPSDLRHALLLPPTVFLTTSKTQKYWHRCDVYSRERIAEAEALLSLVEKEHRKRDNGGGRSWVDGRKLRYKFDPSKHSLSSAERTGTREFRFCYEVVPGFHYDVTEENGRAFSVEIGGKVISLSRCNVTPWGHVRKG